MELADLIRTGNIRRVIYDIPFNEDWTDEELCNHIVELNCSQNKLTSLPPLPLATELRCSHNQLRSLGASPRPPQSEGVLGLERSSSRPDVLGKAENPVPLLSGAEPCYSRVTSLPLLPSVTELDCSYNQLTSLPPLPLVTELYCSYNQLRSLGSSPEGVTSLPSLPSVTELDCSFNQLTSLPPLPQCTKLRCHDNKLTSLSPLPLIKKLYCWNNKLISLPPLPQCTKLWCPNNLLPYTNLIGFKEYQIQRKIEFINIKKHMDPRVWFDLLPNDLYRWMVDEYLL